MSDWTERYRPETLSAIRGNDKARDQLASWARAWPEKGRAVILHGSPGVGKTSAAHALAADLNWEPIELNASDDRTADVIDRVAGEASASASLTAERKLVILDEADNLHQHRDRGGAGAMTSIVKETAQPIVLIANDLYGMSRGLRNACETIEFRDVSARSIVPVLRDICRKENVQYEEEALQQIADQTDGDLRSAINDLQAIAEQATALTVEDVITGHRDRTEGIFTFLDAVLKEEDPQTALYTAYDVDETPDDLLLWVEDKVPKVYEGAELPRAYRSLAAGDVWLGRVRATQNYGYWRYVTAAVAAGVASARDHERGGWTRYGGAPYRSQRDSTRDEVARRIAETADVSTGTARRVLLPFLSMMTHHCRERELTVRMAARYDLDAEAVAFITGSGEGTNKVQSIVEDATQQRDDRAAASARTQGRTVTVSQAAESEPEESNSDQEEETEADDDEQAGLADFV